MLLIYSHAVLHKSCSYNLINTNMRKRGHEDTIGLLKRRLIENIEEGKLKYWGRAKGGNN